jgi:hypothetical protein
MLLFILNLCLLVPQHVSANSYAIIRGVITNCIRCALNGNYKTVKQLKMLKTSVKFLCWFGFMLLIFGLVSVRHEIPGVYAVGYPAYRARCVRCSVVEHKYGHRKMAAHTKGAFQ